LVCEAVFKGKAELNNMEYEELRKKLKKYGYTRKTQRLSEFSNKTVTKIDFSDKSLNHSRLCNSSIVRTNFNNAALTGSYFYNCEFLNCKMKMNDLEYCEFFDCSFTSKYAVVSSFNESNFIKTTFKKISFSGSSFSGAFFDGCTFENVKIEFSTLENSLFRNCNFCNMDMKVLNLDYTEFENPQMDNVVLPLEQITHCIGLLYYCKTTSDNIIIGSDSSVVLSKEEYWENVIPLLEEEYTISEDFFPLANIYLVKQEYTKANDVIHQGLTHAVTNRDFRTIKFYCKLIKSSEHTEPHELHSFYHTICRLSPNPNIVKESSLLRGYIRNIGEIKNILFDSTKKATLHMTFLTNILSEEHNRIGKIISSLFDISKMKEFKIPNMVKCKISPNSPLLIDLTIEGEEENIVGLFPILLSITNTNRDMPTIKTKELEIDLQEYSQLEKRAQLCRSFCIELGVVLNLVEYYFENCTQIIPSYQNMYFYNSNLSQYNRYINGN
jgi:uncharacterized protein YjbI with pentapeptide repeats